MVPKGHCARLTAETCALDAPLVRTRILLILNMEQEERSPLMLRHDVTITRLQWDTLFPEYPFLKFNGELWNIRTINSCEGINISPKMIRTGNIYDKLPPPGKKGAVLLSKMNSCHVSARRMSKGITFSPSTDWIAPLQQFEIIA